MFYRTVAIQTLILSPKVYKLYIEHKLQKRYQARYALTIGSTVVTISTALGFYVISDGKRKVSVIAASRRSGTNAGTRDGNVILGIVAYSTAVETG
jgi:hypothetical protein